MTEDDRRRVANFRKILDDDDPFTHGFSSKVGRQLLAIIDRLDDERIKQHDTIINYRDEVGHLKAQLTELKEAGKDFVVAYEKHLSTLKGGLCFDDVYESAETQSRFMSLRQLGLGLANFSRLAEALKGVEDD